MVQFLFMLTKGAPIQPKLREEPSFTKHSTKNQINMQLQSPPYQYDQQIE